MLIPSLFLPRLLGTLGCNTRLLMISMQEHTPLLPLDDDQLKLVLRCEELIGYEFKNKRLLYEAITHASVANTRLKSYERLEFLGDSILGFICCEYLFNKYPDWLEGDLTKIKSKVVSRRSCSHLGRKLNIEPCLVVGKGVGLKGKVPRSLLANAFESIVAAIYLDGDWVAAREFLVPLVAEQVEEAVAGGLEVNFKSDLQQYSQKRYGVPPVYTVLNQRGPDHDKWFFVSAKVNKKSFPAAWGQNKKEAQQRAAANALAEIHGEPIPYIADA